MISKLEIELENDREIDSRCGEEVQIGEAFLDAKGHLVYRVDASKSMNTYRQAMAYFDQGYNPVKKISKSWWNGKLKRKIEIHWRASYIKVEYLICLSNKKMRS